MEFDGFTLDTQHRVLLWKTEQVSLSPKQFDLLCFFVHNSGRLLAKEEILQSVWQDQFVEEGSLTQTVYWVRKALAHGATDSDDARRHIVTIPGKGYQFNFLETQAGNTALEQKTALAEAEPTRPAADKPRRRTLWASAAIAALVIGIGIAAVARYTRQRSSAEASSGPQEIVLGEFSDNTPDTSLKAALGTALRIGLEQSPRLSIAQESEVEETLHYMKQPAAASLTPSLARQVCQRRGAQAFVLGNISSVGEQYLISVEARECASGKAIWATQGTATHLEQIVSTLNDMLPSLRTRLGESSASIRQFNSSIEQATTPSLEAFKAYVAGEDLRQQGENIQAIPLYQHAIALDPNFAMAYARLGACYATLSERPLSARAYTTAYQLSANVSQPEKFYIRSLYTHRVERNMVETIRVHDEWRTLYPQDPHSWISETDAFTQMGRFDDAIRIGETGYRQFPHYGMMANAMARVYQRSGRFSDLQRVAADAASKGIESWDIHEMLLYRAWVLGDAPAAEAELSWVKGKPEEYQALDDIATWQLQQGRWHESLATWARFEETAKQQSMTGYADIDVGLYAAALVEYGLRSQAISVMKRWPAVNPTPEYARGLAAIGQEAQAEAIMVSLLKDHPQDTLLLLWHKPILEATIALNHPGDAAAQKALNALEAAKGMQARDYGVGYLRGKAYLRLHKYTDAVAEFQAITDSPGLDPTSPLRVLALLHLGHASSLLHNSPAAESAFRSVHATWQNADHDLPSITALQN